MLRNTKPQSQISKRGGDRTMRQCECVKADTPSEFAHEHNVLNRKISRRRIEHD